MLKVLHAINSVSGFVAEMQTVPIPNVAAAVKMELSKTV
jgi:hypothetical protein